MPLAHPGPVRLDLCQEMPKAARGRNLRQGGGDHSIPSNVLAWASVATDAA